jgi:hypothetical protein
MQSSFLKYTSFKAVTPSDTTLVNCRAIYIGGAGNIALSIDGATTAVTLTAPPVGTILPIELNAGRIMSTNTTATLIVALM